MKLLSNIIEFYNVPQISSPFSYFFAFSNVPKSKNIYLRPKNSSSLSALFLNKLFCPILEVFNI